MKLFNHYGQLPQDLGVIGSTCEEYMFYMYLPIKMAGSGKRRIPKQLQKNFGLQIMKSLAHYSRTASLEDKYIYITAKNKYATTDNPGNRPGYHCDGFGTKDINYIWCDKHPTVFCEKEFILSDDCPTALKEMKDQIDASKELTYPEGSLLRLDQYNVHRAPNIPVAGMRAFFKLSISEHKYNLKGNSHNYGLDYAWKMYDRDKVRNHPSVAEQDYIIEGDIRINF